MRMPIVVNRRSDIPLHRQIYDEWRKGILAGRFSRGDRMPSTRELAATLRVSRTTATAAYEQLIAEGYFQTARGSGTFVSPDLPDEPLKPAQQAKTAGGARAVRISSYGRRLEPALARRPSADGVISLSKHRLEFEQFPIQLWRRLILRHLRHVTPAVFEYADHGAGHQDLRREIALYVGRSRAVRCTSDQVIVVNGSQQALDLCARVLIDPGDEVTVENPGYLGARQLFAAHGARLRPVPVTIDGISVSDLPDTTRLVYTTPSHQFPTGVSMSLARRLEIVEWARQRSAVVVEDDYDSEYRYSGPPLPALQGLTEAVPVIYVGTFSNVMFPGLRIGYLILPQQLIEPFRRAKWHSDRHTALLEQAALADFLHEGHLERHIRRMRRLYKQRREVLIDALRRHFGTDATVLGDAAGMYLVVRFSVGGIDARAKKHGVHMASTAPYYTTVPPPHEYVIRFSALPERTIREGVKRLAG